MYAMKSYSRLDKKHNVMSCVDLQPSPKHTMDVPITCVCGRMRTSQIQPSPEHLKATGLKQLPAYDCNARISRITVPNLNLGYPEELGGRCEGMLSQTLHSHEDQHGQCRVLYRLIRMVYAGTLLWSRALSAVRSSHNSRTTVLVSS